MSFFSINSSLREEVGPKFEVRTSCNASRVVKISVSNSFKGALIAMATIGISTLALISFSSHTSEAGSLYFFSFGLQNSLNDLFFSILHFLICFVIIIGVTH